jgi:hypothetical protein
MRLSARTFDITGMHLAALIRNDLVTNLGNVRSVQRLNELVISSPIERYDVELFVSILRVHQNWNLKIRQGFTGFSVERHVPWAYQLMPDPVVRKTINACTNICHFERSLLSRFVSTL